MTHDAGNQLFENLGTEAQLLTARELASRLAIDLKKVYRMVEAKQIPGLLVGKQWRFIWRDVLGALKQGSCYGDQGS